MKTVGGGASQRSDSCRALNPLTATLTDPPVNVANKRLTVLLSPLNATLTRNTGGVSVMVNGYLLMSSFASGRFSNGRENGVVASGVRGIAGVVRLSVVGY